MRRLFSERKCCFLFCLMAAVLVIIFDCQVISRTAYMRVSCLLGSRLLVTPDVTCNNYTSVFCKHMRGTVDEELISQPQY